MSRKRSRIHPNYKTKYRVKNWASYDKSLVERGDLTIWMSPAAIRNWNAKPKKRRGAPAKYSNLAIETAVTLRLILHFPLRQTEGFLRWIFGLMDLNLEAPDHTTLSRRSRTLRNRRIASFTDQPINLVIDSSGLAVFGEGEWAVAKHRGNRRRGWRKLHLAVSQTGEILGHKLTSATGDDAKNGSSLLRKLPQSPRTVTADSAYDAAGFYAAAAERDTRTIVPPYKNARPDQDISPGRDRTLRWVEMVGRVRWKRDSLYHRQSRVENTFFRYKTIIGDRLRARHPKGRETEARLACNILNRMAKLGMPNSVKIEG